MNSVIYIVRASELDSVKIGVTSNLRSPHTPEMIGLEMDGEVPAASPQNFVTLAHYYQALVEVGA